MKNSKKHNFREYLKPDKNEDDKKILVCHWVINSIFLLVFSGVMGIFCLKLATAGYSIELFKSFFGLGSPNDVALLLLVLNLLPIALLTLICFFAFNRMMPAILTSGALVLALSCVNYFKLAFRNDPFLFSDITFASEAANMMNNYKIKLTGLMYAMLAFIVIMAVLAHFFMKARIRRRAIRIAAPFAAAVVFAVLVLTLYSSSAVYNKACNVYVPMPEGEGLNYWNEVDQYCSRGFIYPFIHSATQMRSVKPVGYSKDEAQALTEGVSVPIDDSKKVNFISIMLEAYSDLSPFDIEYEMDPYEYFRQLQASSVSGELVTNIFAGGTIDTERTYITGSTEMYEYRGAADSLARYFNDNGYFTQFCHPGYGWFYNRQNVMEYLGFQSVHFFEDRYDYGTGYLISDDLFFSDLITLFEECVSSGSPYFNFSVTYQNHGPYDTDKLVEDGSEYVAQGELSDYSYYALNNYLNGIAQTDEALRNFIGYFEESGEPTVIVLFGDHKPWLGDSNLVYTELNADFSLESDESFYQYYNTPYIIWANDAAKKVLGNNFAGDGGDFSPCFLSMKLFDLCSYDGSYTTQALRALNSQLDVVSITGRHRMVSTGVLSQDLSEDAQAALNEYWKLQYYCGFDMY